MTAQEVPVLRWSPEEFVDAYEVGAFGERERVQLVDGEVWALGPMQGWHGDTVAEIAHLLRAGRVRVSVRTLPMPASMPDPDAWVRRDEAVPVGVVRGYEQWAPEDVLLVVEVSDSTLRADLTVKAAMYAEGGVGHYWVVARDALHVHREPGPDGYGRVEVLGPEDTVNLPYAPERVLAVRDLIGA